MTAVNDENASTAPSPRYRARLLGDFALSDDVGRDVTPNRRKARALLAYLALQNGSATRERLAGLLWGDRAEEQARASLRQTLYELRELTIDGAPLISGDREDVTLSNQALATDIGQIEGLAAAHNFQALEAAVARWSGPLLADMNGVDRTFDEWLRPMRERMHTRLIDTILAAVDHGDADARTVHAIGIQLQTIDPLNEQILRLLMRADAKLGDVAAAHRRFSRFAEQLAQEMQTKPSQETRRLLRDLDGKAMDDMYEPAATTPASNARGGETSVARVLKPRRRTAAWLAVAAAAAMTAAPMLYFLLRGAPSPKSVTADQSVALDLTTLELYKRARHAILQRTEVDSRSAAALLEEAVSRAPWFSRGWSALAFVQLGLANGGAEDAFEKESAALSSARKALELDASNADAYLTLAWHANGTGKNGEAFEALDRGLSIEPQNADLLRTRGQFLLVSGRTNAAIADLKRACALDPLDPRALSLLVTALRDAGRNTEAALLLEGGLKRFPNYRHLVAVQLKVLILDGRYNEADRILTSGKPLPTAWMQELAQNRLPLIRVLRSGRKQDADALVARLREKGRTNDFGNEAVWQLAVLGRYQDAYDLLKDNYIRTYSGGGRSLRYEEAIRRDWMAYDVENFADAAFSTFRRDPAFLYIFDDDRRLDYWLASDKWPDLCADPTLPYDCKDEAGRRAGQHRTPAR